MEEWLSCVPAEWGTSGNGLIDCLPCTIGMFALHSWFFEALLGYDEERLKIFYEQHAKGDYSRSSSIFLAASTSPFAG